VHSLNFYILQLSVFEVERQGPKKFPITSKIGSYTRRALNRELSQRTIPWYDRFLRDSFKQSISGGNSPHS